MGVVGAGGAVEVVGDSRSVIIGTTTSYYVLQIIHCFSAEQVHHPEARGLVDTIVYSKVQYSEEWRICECTIARSNHLIPASPPQVLDVTVTVLFCKYLPVDVVPIGKYLQPSTNNQTQTCRKMSAAAIVVIAVLKNINPCDRKTP